MPLWNWNLRHQVYLYDALERVTSGKCRRLMIFMPPRHGKSETVTVRYTAWRLARDPELKVILGSYNENLANRFSRQIRRVVAERVPLASDRRAVNEWETKRGGSLKAVGVGAGITGFGGSLVIIDDPVKSRAEAESKRRRDTAWDWFCDDIYTRLEPDAAVILIQTRWHEDDLAGRLLRQQTDEGGEQWTVIELPAIAVENDPLERKPGEALWESRFGIERLGRVRSQLGTYSFSALYQQRPVPSDGGIFKRSWFGRIVDRAPEGLRWARGYDLAVSTRTTADHTASFRCAFDAAGMLYIADGFRGRIEYPDQRRYILERIAAEPNTSHGIESALHGPALVQDLRRSSKGIGRAILSVRPDRDKITRALSWSPLAEDGKVVLVRGPWIDEFIAEACAFPHGDHDDQIDAVSIAVKMLSAPGNKFHRF